MSETGTDSLSASTYTQSETIRSESIKSSNNEEGKSILLSLFQKRSQWKMHGKLKVYCGGFFIIAPVRLWWWMSEIFIIVTLAVFAIEFNQYNWFVILPAIVIAFVEWLAFYKTCLRDPGIHPRSSFDEAFQTAISVVKKWQQKTPTSMTIRHPNGITETYHYCWRCHHYRSILTNHCSTCDCCMIEHDHHCPVFGGCVAQNNLRAFYAMVVTMIGFWIYTLGVCILKMASTSEENVKKHNVGPGAPESVHVAAQITFFVILGEIAAVIFIPPFLAVFTDLFSKEIHYHLKQQAEMPRAEQIEMMIQFGRETLKHEELIDLFEVLNVDYTSQPIVNINSNANDLNHNPFYSLV